MLFIICILAYGVWLHHLYTAFPSIESISKEAGITIPGSAKVVGFYYHSFMNTDMLVRMQLDKKSVRSLTDAFPSKSERSSASRFEIDDNIHPPQNWWKASSIKQYVAFRWFIKSNLNEVVRRPSVRLLMETPPSSNTTVYLRYEYPD